MDGEKPEIVDGLLHFRSAPFRTPQKVLAELKEEMERDAVKPSRTVSIDDAVSSIAAIVEIADAAPQPWTESLAKAPLAIPDYYPEEIQARLRRALRPRSKRGRPTTRPEKLVLILDVAITQWHAATGQLPSQMELADLPPNDRIGAPLFHLLRRMLRHVSPNYRDLLTGELFLSTLGKYSSRIEYTVLGQDLPPARRRGRPKTRKDSDGN